ncbi:hypothetical protein [Micromonospora cathayae]|uniref:AAA ATPase domain-containing protein n=1 Tax=Micromonospora cathayae TaxID=3028804 RepID=A0ABY7ZNY2_9ACTN|nr:hypothetical protein [Micromonospora sp. HUAS 3]WDZ84711.1 hypothetical protein PVK37_30520 [Micromonospora sp. HUAS 3]
MTETMKSFRCWSTADVRRTVYSDIGALSIDADAVFLAAHTPMSIKHAKGIALNPGFSGEQQVLTALMEGFGDSERNTLVAVTGGSGAGKSHIVRWVHAHLRAADDQYRILYVPRAIQTLRELLRRLVTELPGVDGSDFMKRIDAAVGNISEEQLADKLLEEMRYALTWQIEEQSPVPGESDEERDLREDRNNLLGERDENGKRRDGLADLLALPELNRWLLRKEGLLRDIARTSQTESSRRDRQHNRFTVDDLPLRKAQFAKEARSRAGLQEIRNLIVSFPEPALELLGDALEVAVPRAFGTRAADGDTLDSLFRQSREALWAEGLELVLLFEDLAQFGLIDGELYDQFVIQPGADLAPLRVVYAVTTGHSRIPKTVLTRITHEFEVDDSALKDRSTFLARYLNLVRVGRENIDEARAGESPDATDWIPNACDTREDGSPCRFRSECHAGFGTVEVSGLGRVGLFPYNDYALRQALAGPKANPPGEAVTPRRLLETLIQGELIRADTHLAAGHYPDPEIKDRFNWQQERPEESLIGTQQGPDAQRLLRALVLWGAEKPLPPQIVEAFGLPVRQAAPKPAGPVAPQPRPQPPAPPAQPVAKERTPMRELAPWGGGKDLPNVDVDRYRNMLRDMLGARLQLDQDLYYTEKGAGKDVLNSILGLTSFDIEGPYGRVAAATNRPFELKRGKENVRFLFGAYWWYIHGHWKPDEGTWEWPDSYQVGEIMAEVEARFDDWAEQVRQRFREKVKGRGPARAALGVRTIALRALGVPPEDLDGVTAVLRYRDDIPEQRETQDWGPVHLAARAALRRAPALDYANQFAAVRQGTAPNPQLFDIAELDSALREAAESPAGFLRATAAEYQDAAPVVALAASELLKALTAEGPARLAAAKALITELAEGLAHCDPTTIADAAEKIGLRAARAGVNMFRPANGWEMFLQKVELLRDLRPELLADVARPTAGNPVDDVLALRPYLRDVLSGVESLRFLKLCLEQTAAEAVRQSRVHGDPDQLAQVAREDLSRVEEFMQVLAGGGAV